LYNKFNMKLKDIYRLIKGLEKKYQIFAPQKIDNRLLFKKLERAQDFDYSGKIPDNSFKEVVFPDRHVLYKYEDTKVKPVKYKSPDLALFGLTIFDMKALDFLKHALEKDPYFQARIRKMVVVGQSYVSEKGDQADQIEKNYEDNVLEHIQFDIFIKRVDNDKFKLYTGSQKGQKILEFLGFNDYDHIQYRSILCQLEPAQTNKENIIKTKGKKVWQKWGQQCLGCTKCTVACPTCYCYQLEHVVTGENKGKVVRRWSSCFMDEFSEIAGGNQFLETTGDKIYNWYYHKHVRNHDELCIVGCVGCGRCDKVCPAGIKRLDVLNSLKSAKNKSTSGKK